MTPRPLLPIEPFSDEERDLAARLDRLDAAAGPSAALDARILAAARAASAPARRVRHWPTAVGAAAVFVVAVGLAWQLRPMFELPPPAPRHVESTGDAATRGAHSETVVQIESVPRVPAPAPAAATVADQPVAVTPPPAAARKAPSVAGGAAATPAARPRSVARTRSPDFVDEAVPMRDATPVPVAAPPPPASPAPPAAQESMRVAAPPAANEAAPAATAETAVAGYPDVSADTRLPVRAWLARIRERRDGGDLDGARASLQQFVSAHPHVRVPTDLRPLLRDDDPWSP